MVNVLYFIVILLAAYAFILLLLCGVYNPYEKELEDKEQEEWLRNNYKKKDRSYKNKGRNYKNRRRSYK